MRPFTTSDSVERVRLVYGHNETLSILIAFCDMFVELKIITNYQYPSDNNFLENEQLLLGDTAKSRYQHG